VQQPRRGPLVVAALTALLLAIASLEPRLPDYTGGQVQLAWVVRVIIAESGTKFGTRLSRQSARLPEQETRSIQEARFSSNSAVSVAFADTLASMTTHSCQAFAYLRVTPDTGT
jgi:hypothetical protein